MLSASPDSDCFLSLSPSPPPPSTGHHHQQQQRQQQQSFHNTLQSAISSTEQEWLAQMRAHPLFHSHGFANDANGQSLAAWNNTCRAPAADKCLTAKWHHQKAVALTVAGCPTTTTTTTTMPFSREQQQLLPPKCQCSDFDLLRWAHAYKGDIDQAVHKFRRHLRIREILRLDDIERLNGTDGLDEAAEHYAPLDILGPVSNSDGRILLLERSGHFQLDQMMQSIRTSAFMLNRFRLMERILRAIRQSEQTTGRRQSGVLVLDLAGIRFHPGLVGFISGPYRIMWGTLVEQYPSLLSAIIVLNCPASVSVLWTACASFIGEDYRQRVYLLGRDWRERMAAAEAEATAYGELVPLEAMPVEEYGGKREYKFREPQPCQAAALLPCLPAEINGELELLNVPAGDFLMRTYFLSQGELLQFVMGHEKELTMNMVFSTQKRLIRPEQISQPEEQSGLVEVFAGCERPGMVSLDCWQWQVPHTGFFHLAFGNKKAWILSVSLKFQLFQLHANGQKVKVQPIPEEHLRAQA